MPSPDNRALGGGLARYNTGPVFLHGDVRLLLGLKAHDLKLDNGRFKGEVGFGFVVEGRRGSKKDPLAQM